MISPLFGKRRSTWSIVAAFCLASSGEAQTNDSSKPSPLGTNVAPAAGTPLGGPGRRALGGSGSRNFGELGSTPAPSGPSPSPKSTSSYQALTDRFDRAVDPR